MIKERAITYSLLAHIRNTGTLAGGPIDIFTPLLKRTLSKINSEKIYSGESIIEIKDVSEKLYSIDFPLPVLRKILGKISKEINTEQKTVFYLYNDDSYSIIDYVFEDYEIIVDREKSEIDKIENLFSQFCSTSEHTIQNSESIFSFIEANKYNLSQYFSKNYTESTKNYIAEAQFIDFFRKFPEVYNRIKDIYLGSIISGYLSYPANEVLIEVELLLDTNFVIGLLDLNTPESTHTCQTLLKIAKNQKYTVSILTDTINEIMHLLESKAADFDKTFLQKKINKEDIFNACERRKITKVDLERIKDNVKDELSNRGINVIEKTEWLKAKAEKAPEYKSLLKMRGSKISALHDATAIVYVQNIRKDRIKNFEDAKAWFVNNTSSLDGKSIHSQNGYLPESIKADDLLNILWLSNPQINSSIQTQDLSEIGLTSAISLTLNHNLPKTAILKELDDNIHKYGKEKISDTDILRVSTRITNRQLTNIEELNELANKDKDRFVRRLEEEAKKQKELDDKRNKGLEEFLNKISKEQSLIDKNNKDLKFAQDENIELKSLLSNEIKIKKDDWMQKEIRKWRYKILCLILYLVILPLLLIISIEYIFDMEILKAYSKPENKLVYSIVTGFYSIIISGIIIKSIYDKCLNHVNITSFKNSLEVPSELDDQYPT